MKTMKFVASVLVLASAPAMGASTSIEAAKFVSNARAIVSDMRRHFDSQQDFQMARNRLWHLVGDFNPDISPPPQSEVNGIADDLIDLVEERKAAPDRLLIAADFAARYANSDKAKQFVVRALKSESSSLRKGTANALYRNTSLKRVPEIFSALADLAAKDAEDYDSLVAMPLVDLEKSRPVLEARLAAAKDIRTFNKLGMVISATHDIRLIRRLLERLPDFQKMVDPRMAGRIDENNTPNLAIRSDALADYVRQAEGDELDFVLSRIPAFGVGSDLNYAISEKLQSSLGKRTQMALSKCIVNVQRNGGMVGKRILESLRKRILLEKDPETKKALAEAVGAIQAGRLSPGAD